MVEPHTSNIQTTYEYTWVTYGWHTNACEWNIDIRVQKSDMPLHTSTYEWHTSNIGVYMMWIASAKSRSPREHLTSQLIWATAWLSVTGICCVYLVDEFSPCAPLPLIIELMVVLFDVFLDIEYGFISVGSWCYSRGWVMVVLFEVLSDGMVLLL